MAARWVTDIEVYYVAFIFEVYAGSVLIYGASLGDILGSEKSVV